MSLWFDAAGAVRGQPEGLIVARGGQLYRVESRVWPGARAS
jgi:hypothetical protein